MTGPRRIPANACHPAVVEQARALVTESLLAYPAIAWEVGVALNTVLNWKTRYGWVRPPAKRRERGVVRPDEVAGRPRRFSRGGSGKGRYYAPEVVEAVRRMVEESVLTQGAIAARAGISHETIRVWTRRHGWVRPAGTTLGADGRIVTRRRGRREASVGPIGQRHPNLRHAEERPEAASRSTHDGCASFETSASRSPEDDDVGSLRSVSREASARVDGAWVASPDQVRGPAAPPRNDGNRDDPCEGQPWRDALLPPGFLLPQNRRASGGKGRPYLRPVVERVRELVEGSALSQAAIAARTGVGSATVSVWMREKGWRRPLDAYRSTHEVPADRTGLSPRLAAAFARLAEFAEGEIASGAAPDLCLPPCGEGGPSEAEGRMGVAPPLDRPGVRRNHPQPGSTLRVDSSIPPRGRDGAADGWDGSEVVALDRLARAARRWAFRYDREGLSRLAPSRRLAPGDPWEPIRISAVPKGPRHHPRGADMLAQARIAWERSRVTRETIARELGIGRTTLTRWAQMGGWIRPDGAHSPFAGRPRNRGLRHRIAQRAEAVRRLEEAERMLEGAAGFMAFEAVFGLLRDAARIVGRGCPPGCRHA